MGVTIRAGQAEDGSALRAIERQAGERFRDVGRAEVADDEPMSVDELATYAIGGRSWVAIDQADDADDAHDADVPIGYALAEVLDGQAHLEQMSVRPDQQGAGVGRALLDRVSAWAVDAGRARLTLTTFTDVAWNRPLYEHLGFRVLAEDEIGPELRARMVDEAAHGLDPATRVAMVRNLRVP